jgi:hypothetical protein
MVSSTAHPTILSYYTILSTIDKGSVPQKGKTRKRGNATLHIYIPAGADVQHTAGPAEKSIHQLQDIMGVLQISARRHLCALFVMILPTRRDCIVHHFLQSDS